MEGCPLWFVAPCGCCGMLRCESWEQPSIQPFVSPKESTPDVVPCTPNTREFVWYKVLSFATSEISECWAAPAGKKLLCSPWGLCLKGCATLGCLELWGRAGSSLHDRSWCPWVSCLKLKFAYITALGFLFALWVRLWPEQTQEGFLVIIKFFFTWCENKSIF